MPVLHQGHMVSTARIEDQIPGTRVTGHSSLLICVLAANALNHRAISQAFVKILLVPFICYYDAGMKTIDNFQSVYCSGRRRQGNGFSTRSRCCAKPFSGCSRSPEEKVSNQTRIGGRKVHVHQGEIQAVLRKPLIEHASRGGSGYH